jgi:hypothetical protein
MITRFNSAGNERVNYSKELQVRDCYIPCIIRRRDESANLYVVCYIPCIIRRRDESANLYVVQRYGHNASVLVIINQRVNANFQFLNGRSRTLLAHGY